MNYLIVGLGNIGPEYLFTRHNIGFMAVDYLARQKDIKFSTDRLGSITSYKLKGKTIYLLKPNTYMMNTVILVYTREFNRMEFR